MMLNCQPFKLQLNAYDDDDDDDDGNYSGFHLSVESNLHLLWFCIAMLMQ